MFSVIDFESVSVLGWLTQIAVLSRYLYRTLTFPGLVGFHNVESRRGWRDTTSELLQYCIVSNVKIIAFAKKKTFCFTKPTTSGRNLQRLSALYSAGINNYEVLRLF